MAEEKILTVSLKEYKKSIDELKASMLGLDSASEEYKNIANEVKDKQDKLNAVMKDAKYGIDEEANSLNSLRRQLSEMKAEAAKMDVGSDAFKEASKNIYELNERLSEAEQSQGNFSRNVGNYTNSMTQALNNVGINIGNISPLFANLTDNVVRAGAQGKGALAGLGVGVKGLGMALKSLAANPIGAIIMAIVLAVKAAKAVFDSFKKSVEGNEKASNNMSKAMAPIKAIVNSVKEVFDNFVETLTKVAAAIGGVISSVLEFFGIAGEQVSLENQIADMQAKNAEEHRKNIVENAKLELDASEARAKAADKEKYTAQERKAYMEEYAEKQKEIAANQLKEAENELKLLEAQASTGKNNKEMNDKLAEAQAKVLNVQKQYNDTLRSTTKELNKLNSEIDKEAEDKLKKAQEAWKKHNEEVKRANEAYNKLFDKFDDENRNELDLAVKRIEAEEKLNLAIIENKANLDKSYKNSKQYYQDIQEVGDRANAAIMKAYETNGAKVQAFYDKMKKVYFSDRDSKIQTEKDKWTAISGEIEEAFNNGLIDEATYNAQMQKMAASADAAIQAVKANIAKEELSKYITESLTPSNAEVTEMKNKIVDAFLADTIDSDKATELLASLGFDSDSIAKILQEAKDKAESVQLGAIFDELTDSLAAFTSTVEGTAGIIGDEMANLVMCIGQVATAVKKGEKGWKSYAAVAATALAGVGTMLSSLADEEEGNTKESFKRKQDLEIASAIMNMAAGIVSVWPAAMELGPIAGPIVGAALTAMIAGIGGAQIAQIKNTKLGGSSSSNTTMAYTPVAPLLNENADINSLSSLNVNQDNDGSGSQRVYILQSDLENSARQVSVRQSNTSF